MHPREGTDNPCRGHHSARRAVCLLVFLGMLSTARAQTDTATTQLQEVTVYARANRLDDMVPTQRLGGTQLEALSGHSVADAVRYFAGVQLKDYGGVGGLKTVDIRSMGSNHMGIFYDGVQLGNAQNGQVDLGKFSMDNIEEIVLYNGQKSDLWQPAKDYGSGGTIYLHTRQPRFQEGKNYNVRVGYKVGSFGVQNPSMLWEHRWSSRLSSSLSAEYLHATGKYKYRYRRTYANGTTAWDTTATRQNGDVEAFRVEGALHGRFGKGTWNTRLYYYDSERGIPGAIVNNVWKHHQRQWDRNAFAQGSLKLYPSSRYKMLVRWKLAQDWMRYLNPDTTSMYVNNRFLQREVYLTTAHHVTITDAWQADVSADWQLNTLSSNQTNFANPRRNTLLWALATSYQLWRFRAMGSLLGTHTRDHVKSGYSGDDHNRLTPAIFLSYRHNQALTIRAFYKQIFRMPTFNDLYYTDVGNISLEPETATQYDVGVLWTTTTRAPRLHLQSLSVELKVDAYLNWVDNKIVAIPKGSGQYRWMMMNIGKVRIRGAELSAQTVAKPHPDWAVSLLATYTYQSAQDRSDPTDRGEGGTWNGQIAYIPHHSASVTANVGWRSWSLNYAFIYVGERWHNSANILANHEEPWYTSDLSIRRQLRLGSTLCSATLEVNNLLNQQYEVVLNYPMPGRNWKLILKCDF